MKLIVISDIHGNCVALDAVLADIQHESGDQIICLGDAVQGGPQPAEVVQRLRERGCPVVMGNADAWLLTGEETEAEQVSSERRQKMDRIREWSLAQLSAADQAFIGDFQPTIEMPLTSGRHLFCFHGSPTSFDDLIFPDTPEAEFQRLLAPYARYILTGGHTHLQQIRRLGDNFFFNPGSVGLAYNHQQEEAEFRLDPWAEYAVLTGVDGRIRLEFRRVPFDVAALRRAYQDSGRPYADEAIAQYARAPYTAS
jgi:predicted phosphodiesterase